MLQPFSVVHVLGGICDAAKQQLGIDGGPPWQPGGSPFHFLISAIYVASGLPTLIDFSKRLL